MKERYVSPYRRMLGQRMSRRRALAASGVAGLGAAGLALVGCGDDDDEAISQAIAQVIEEEQAQAQVTEEGQVAAVEQAAEEIEQAAEEAGVDAERDLIVAQAALFTTLDQELANTHESQEADVMLHSTLIRNKIVEQPGGFLGEDVTGPWEPRLAVDWSKSEDGTTYEFTLREGVVSYNGNPFTADDVTYTMERKIAAGGVGSFIAAFAAELFDPDQIQRIDDFTVQFRLNRPYPTFEQTIMAQHVGAIVDSKLMKENATEDDPWSAEWAVTHSHGFGAYQLESFTQGEQAVFLRNEGWARGDGINPAQIERIIWRVVPESANRLALVRRGDVHIAKAMLAREQVGTEGEEGTYVPTANTNLNLWSVTNMNEEVWGDTRVRQALAYIIPYDDMINTVYEGLAIRAFSYVWPPIPGAAPEHSHQYVTDIDKAKELLAEAGVPDGFDIDMSYELALPDQEEAAVLMRESAAKAGIRLNLVALPPAAADENRGTPEARQPTWLVRSASFVQTMPYYLQLFFQSGSPINFAFYDTGRAQWDDFWAAVQSGIEVGDDQAPDALAFYDTAQRILAEDAPFQHIAWTNPQYIFRDNVSGFHYRGDNLIDYGDIVFTA